MLSPNQSGNLYTVARFSVDESNADLVSGVYKRLSGWESNDLDWSGADDFEGYSAEELLEIIDRLRIPLATKKLAGEPLSNLEESYLSILESLTDKVLNLIAPIPEEKLEVLHAMSYAKGLLRGA